MSSEPISIEELVKRKKQEQEQASKPRFLSKAERAKLALEKRAHQVAQQQNSSAKRTFSQAVDSRSADSRSGYGYGSSRNNSAITNATSTTNESRAANNTKTKNGFKVKTQGDFRFGWAAEDDTLDTSDPLYSYSARPLHTPGTTNTTTDPELKRLKTDFNEVHWSQKPLDKMKDRDWRIFKEDFQIVTKGNGALANPLRSWKESSIPKVLLSTVDSLGYKEPTPIQRAAIPIALAGRDVVGVAETGSGKTASFVIPMLTYILALPKLTDETKADGPYSIVLAPTRELAQQIEKEAKKFAIPCGFRVVSIVGGHNFEEQAYELDKGAEIIIATPGRLVDCIERRLVVLSQCHYVVMDEADRMIDLGFENSLTAILDALPVSNQKPRVDMDDTNVTTTDDVTSFDITSGQRPKYRQTMMYTATWSRDIELMAEKYVRQPGRVIIGNIGQATDSVEQKVEFISSEDRRLKRVVEILNSRNYRPPIIVFVNFKKNCDTAVKELVKHGWKAVSMHGGKSQEAREAALAQLRSGAADVLVATDVAGRGIDVPNVSLVINLQMTKNIESYTHRIGRTGRAGKKGTAITFLDVKEDADVIRDLRTMIQKSPRSRLSEEFRKLELVQRSITD